jgi:chitinase
MTVTVGRWGSSAAPATVRISTGNGTATAGSDYTALVNRLVTFPAGVVAVDVSVDIFNDAAVEGDETFAVALSAPTGAALGTQKAALVTIVE